MQCRRLMPVYGILRRSLWSGSEPLSTSDPEVFNLLKQEKKRQVQIQFNFDYWSIRLLI